MPTITNRKTGISYEVTEEEYAIIQNSVLSDEYSLATYNGVISRDDLILLLEDNKLVPYRFYTLEGVTIDELNIIVQAVSTSKLNEVAADIDTGQNYIYDIVSDTAIQTSNEIVFSVTSPLNGQGLYYNVISQRWENRYTPLDFSGKNGINIFPHRGVVAFGAPENSILSIREAGMWGASMVEFDINYTSDGVLVLLHDDSINSQFTNSDGSPIVGTVNINQITYAQALNYIRSSNIDGYKIQITTLDEALQECAKNNLIPLMELKGVFPENLDNEVLKVSRKYFNDQDILLQSFNDDIITRFSKKSNYYPVFNSGNINLAKEYRGAIFVAYGTIDQTLVNTAVAANVPIFAYTVNTQSELNRLINLGVVNITSDIISPFNLKGLTFVDNYDSGLNFDNSTVVSGTISSGESLVTLNNAGTLQIPNISVIPYGLTEIDVAVMGTCTIQLYYAGVLYDTITNTSAKEKTFRISRFINIAAGSFYIKITSTQANCKIISIKANSFTLPNSEQNRKFVKAIRSDAGIGINFDAPTGKEILNASSLTPSLGVWDSGGFGRKYAFQQDNYLDNILAVASDTAMYKGTYLGRKSRGTLLNPTAVANGDDVATFLGSAFDGANFRNFASIDVKVDGAVSGGNVPMALIFNTGVTSRTEKARLTSLGAFLINRSTSLGFQNEKLEVEGAVRFGGILTIGQIANNTYPTNSKVVVGAGANGSSASVLQNRLDISFADTGNSTVFFGIINPDYATMVGVLGTRDGGVNKAILYMRDFRVGIGNSNPDLSSVLDITSTTKGFLSPRMTTVQRNAIASPALALEVFDTDLKKKCFWNGVAWEIVTSA